jgi:hypothetical protein
MKDSAWQASPQAVRGRKRQIAKIRELYRLQLFRMCKLRHGNHFVPDSAEGRALLKALLRCKLSGEAVMDAAPWLEPGELQALQRAARRLRLHDIGTQVHLTYAERQEGRLWLLRPCDVPWDEVQRRQRERSVKADRERKRRKRREQREIRERRREMMSEMMGNMPRREEAIMGMLTMDWQDDWQDWFPVSELVQQACTWRSFRCGDVVRSLRKAFLCPNGAPATPSSLRRLVHRTVDKLEDLGFVETMLGKGMRGTVRYVRISKGRLTPDVFCHGDSVTGGILCR